MDSAPVVMFLGPDVFEEVKGEAEEEGQPMLMVRWSVAAVGRHCCEPLTDGRPQCAQSSA